MKFIDKDKPSLMLVFMVIVLVIGLGVGYYIPMGRIKRQNEEIAELNTQLSTYNEQITAFHEIINVTDAQLSRLESKMSELDSQIVRLLSDLKTKESQIIELQKYVPPPENLAPNFTVSDLDGENFTLSDHMGELVLIEFMTTWCGYCGKQIPEYLKLREELTDQITIISISIDKSSDSEERLINYRAGYDAPWVWAIDTANLKELYEVKNIPTTIIVDKNGYIWARYIGFTSSATLVKEFEQLIAYWGPQAASVKFLSISASDAKELLDSNPNIIILDVRTTDEFNEEHLEGSINIPVLELQDRMGELDKNNTILVYCKMGVRSAQAAQILSENGFLNIYDMEDGITAWKNLHFPIVIVP
jgi:rhodanese-related sulfurtransferase/cytochrome oxidase Cu insertion factor (SCO1/SenC/PrrC family)